LKLSSNNVIVYLQTQAVGREVANDLGLGITYRTRTLLVNVRWHRGIAWCGCYRCVQQCKMDKQSSSITI